MKEPKNFMKFSKTETFFVLLATGVAVVFGLGAVVVFAMLLLSYAGITTWPAKPTLTVLLTFASLSLAVFLMIVWFMAVAGTTQIEAPAKKLIGRALIGALLGAVAFGATSVFKHAST